MTADLPANSRYNRLLKAISAVLVLYSVSALLLSFASIPRYYQRVVSLNIPTYRALGEVQISNELVTKEAAQRGMTLQVYAIYSIVIGLFISFGFTVVAGLILWKARSNWFHWFTAFILLFFSAGGTGLYEFRLVAQTARYLSIGSLLWPCFLLFLYLFPNGRAQPRGMLWLITPILLVHLFIQFSGFAELTLGITNQWLDLAPRLFGVITLGFLVIIGSQIYRYIKIFNPVEREQTKWFIGGVALYILLSGLIEWLAGATTIKSSGFSGDLDHLLALIIPISIVIAILRYRLWDIDVIIRRTLVYSILTSILALVYFGGVTLLQGLLTRIGGRQTTASIVISTLSIAALFNPLRVRIQRLIDHRFYRRKYDAQKTLEAFAATARDETDLDRLNAELLQVTKNTMQPRNVSLWMKPGGKR